MTSEFSAASFRSPPGSAAREGLAPMPLFLTGVVFAIAIGLRQVVPLNTDVSWLIVVCQRMLDGQHLYRDIIEINPPMAAFAYLPGVAQLDALWREAHAAEVNLNPAPCGRFGGSHSQPACGVVHPKAGR